MIIVSPGSIFLSYPANLVFHSEIHQSTSIYELGKRLYPKIQSYPFISLQYILGCSNYQMLAWVRLPLAKYGIISGVTMAFARAMGEFGATVMVAGTQETMPIAIYTAANAGERDLANVLSLVLIFISLLTIYLVRGLSNSRLSLK